MKHTLSTFSSILLILLCQLSFAQQNIVPHVAVPLNNAEAAETDYRSALGVEITEPPEFPVRTMAEWEEIQSLVITWTSFPEILKQIAFHTKQECEVIIIANNPSSVTSYLTANNSGGPAFENLDNITIIQDNFDSIWGRDYGAHTIYKDDVDELMFVDWMYNRNRPADDLVPVTLAEHFEVPLYATTDAPYDLMATGGNWMSDGMGTAFSSELILEENSGGGTWWTQFPDHSLEDIEEIVNLFMGIDNYILMDVLPYDAIHHIDMHMKLLDEETIIIGQYPNGIADGPQIEANIEYVLNNYQSPFGTPYEIVRIPMPPEGGSYPNSNGDYRTYTNMVFVNKTVLVPVYEEQYDTPALAIIQEQLPGYNVVGIECNDIIPLSGAIHCITKAVGVDDPLLIIHDHLDDTEETSVDYEITASLQHASDIESATLHYRIMGSDWVATALTPSSANDWTGSIPAQPVGTIIDYYIEGESNSGKQQVRPIVAPEGYWTFEVIGSTTAIGEYDDVEFISEIYPNPANSITVLRASLPANEEVNITLNDMLGRTVEVIFSGTVIGGEQKFFFNAAAIPAGAYNVTIQAGNSTQTERLMIR